MNPARANRASHASRRTCWLPIMAAVLTALLFAAAAPSAAVAASVDVRIDLSSQSMAVSVLGKRKYTWPVSTARRGYRTPTGTFRPIRLERTWYSTIYDNAPMPYSIFFRGGYAIHGTTEVHNLGRPVSHGCVRLHPSNARALFNLVRRYGPSATRITVTR